MMRNLLLFLLLIVAIPLTAQQDNVVTDTAFVNTVEAENTEDGIVLTIRGDLPDACTELGEVSQTTDTSGETLNIEVLVETSRSGDAICAQVLTGFETSFVLDTSDLAPGRYTLDVNGVLLDITIDPTACPEAEGDKQLYNAQGICFLYPEDSSEMSGEGFVLISQEDSDALLLVEIMPEEATLEELAADFEETTPARFGAQDAFIVEDSRADMRQAYVVFEGNRYIFTVQPTSEESGGEALWETVMNSLFFTTETLENE
jgi:hypothetical protein